MNTLLSVISTLFELFKDYRYAESQGFLKKSVSETLYRECKIFSKFYFLSHFSLNYNDILVKSLIHLNYVFW